MTTIILKPNWNIDSIFFHSAGIKYMHVKKVLDNIKKEQHSSATPSICYLNSCVDSNNLQLHPLLCKLQKLCINYTLHGYKVK